MTRPTKERDMLKLIYRPTWCEDCDNVHPASRKREPYYWLCMKFPRLEGHGFVSRKYWTDQEPYMRCNGINGGACATFTAIPDNLNRKG